MSEALSATTLWAMHPAFLTAMLNRTAIEAMLPKGVAGFLATMSGQQQAAKPADPVREGATIIVPVRGLIGPSGLGNPNTLSDVLADRIREFGADPKIGAIVLDIRSPGGYVFGTAELGDAVFEVRASKPVVAVANQYAFSAAHWIATQCSAFYSTTSGEVGSVGVRSGHTDMSGFEDKIGMKTTLIASSPDKIAGHPYGPLSDEDRAEIQAGVDASNVAFVKAIARGRGISVDEVAARHGSGKTFSAAQAMANGAIDGVMTLREVVGKFGSSRARLDLMRRKAAVSEVVSAI